MHFVISILTALMLLFCACTSAHRSGSEMLPEDSPAAGISSGLPAEDLWRQNIYLSDMNQDGFLDIVAPPPRKPKQWAKKPFIFLWGKEAKRWGEGPFEFPALPYYGYGGIAAGDLNGDGLQDIVLAVHTGKIIVLYNSKDGKFLEADFPVDRPYHSRAVGLADVNNDGWTDIIAVSEGPFMTSYNPPGILVGINRKGQGWDTRFVKGSAGLYADSLALADLNGDGNTDIVTAPLSLPRQGNHVWFGDGQGGFLNYGEMVFAGDAEVTSVATGDVDGDGVSEFAAILFKKLQPGNVVAREINVFKWKNGKFENISRGVESVINAFECTLADIDGDRKQELIVLQEGISIYRYLDGSWVRKLSVPVGTYQDISGAFGIEAGRNRDGSSFVVVNLGSENIILKSGIRAYALPPGSVD